MFRTGPINIMNAPVQHIGLFEYIEKTQLRDKQLGVD